MRISLAEARPDLVAEWSRQNGALTPADVTRGSNKKSMVARCLWP